MKLLYFATTTCKPCLTFVPQVERVAKELGIVLERVDANKDTKLAKRYAVMSVPKLVAVDDQYEAIGAIGITTLPKLRAWMEKVKPVHLPPISPSLAQPQ